VNAYVQRIQTAFCRSIMLFPAPEDSVLLLAVVTVVIVAVFAVLALKPVP
jgi:hypothetical protein